MARILIASELGSGYGHFAKVLLLARAFGEWGHRVFAAVKNLDTPDVTQGMTVLPAPKWPKGVSRPGPAVSYAEILARRGYCLPGRLPQMLRSWLQLLDEAAPDLLIADHAPTALLAARVSGVANASVGTGFQAPPATTPYPPLLEGDRRSQERIKIESLVLGAVNHALLLLGAQPANSLQDALSPTKTFLCTFREFDHYPQRQSEDYLGPLYARTEDPPPPAYGKDERGIFCYVSKTMEGFMDLCSAFKQVGLPTLVHARGLSPYEAAGLQAGRLQFTDKPLDIHAAAKKSRLVVTHGGHGATASALLAGCPVLVLPQQVEQMMFARRLEAQQLGIVANPEISAPGLEQVLRGALESPLLTESANKFALRHRGYDPLYTAMRIAKEGMSLLDNSRTA